MAKPNKKLPMATVDIYCAKCKTRLFKYHKGGKGLLVKCFKQRIAQGFTLESCICPGCKTVFARDILVHGTPAFKMIGGKVIFK
ncbi:MAG: hypothetical protein ACI9FJ_000361 [Alteromonadaceae bacterium]|jgi:hypothetical protein